MSVRRMTSYRLFLVRTTVARWSTRSRIRSAAAGTGRLLSRLPRKAGSLLGLIAWFFGQLPPYLARVLEERREDRADLRAERRLLTAQRRTERAERRGLRQAAAAERRARRRAEQAEIKAAREQRHHVAVPGWIARMERPQRPAHVAGARRVPTPRMAMVAAAVLLAAAVPAYAALTGAVGSGDRVRATPAAAEPAQAAGGPSAAPPSADPSAPGSGGAPADVASVGAAPVGAASVSAAPAKPLSAHQQREVRRQAKREAKLARSQGSTQQKPAEQDQGK